jgi:hypothetical protein
VVHDRMTWLILLKDGTPVAGIILQLKRIRQDSHTMITLCLIILIIKGLRN